MSKPDQPRQRLQDTIDMNTPIKVGENTRLEAISLTVVSGMISGDPPRVPIGGQKTFGRTDEADFQAPLDGKISRVHFSIECCPRHGTVRDLGSRNGTFVNGQRVEADREIHHGDQIVAGATIMVVQFVIE